MNKKQKMRLCDYALMLFTVVILLSACQLEFTGSKVAVQIWVHIAIGIIFLILIAQHLYLHFNWRSWFKNLLKQKSPVTRWLAIFYGLVTLSAIIAFIHYVFFNHNSPIGGVHGKIGFVFILLVIGHTLKRLKSPVLKIKK